MEIDLSVVVCVYNEAGNIVPLINQIEQSLSEFSYEIIYVNDGSTDTTLAELRSVQNSRLKVVDLRQNYGQSPALMAGIDVACGDLITTLDGDLQNDPSDIPMMIKKLKDEDWDVVAGIRSDRNDHTFSRKLPSMIANAIIRKTTGVHIKDYGCTLKVFKKDIAKNLGLYGELHRFIPVLASLEGARIVAVPVRHHARIHGVSKYGIGRTFKVISDLVLMIFFKKFMQKPMHLFGGFGIAILIIGVILNIYLFIFKLLGNDIWGKPLLLLAILMVIAGIQIVTLGIILEIQMRTYYESQDKKPYRIRSIYEPGNKS